jgi:hypothetical protein
MEELKQELLFGVSDLDPAQWFAFNLLGFLGGIQVDRRLSLAGLSPWGTSIGSGIRVFRGLGTRITS